MLLVSNTLRSGFRVIVMPGVPQFGRLPMTSEQLHALHLNEGDPVRVAALNGGDKLHG
jgi:arginine/ornithine N-succinyltransferase beta subunit